MPKKRKRITRELVNRWRPLSFTDPVYGVCYFVLWNVKNTREETNAIVEFVETKTGISLKNDRDAFSIGESVARTIAFERKYVLIQFGYGTHPGVRVLVHEAFHAMLAVFRWRSIIISSENDEHGAYYLDWLCGKITEHGHKYKLWNDYQEETTTMTKKQKRFLLKRKAMRRLVKSGN